MDHPLTDEWRQPVLLDLLTDDQPTHPDESRQQLFMTPGQYRQAVLRDLQWLLNAAAMSRRELLENPQLTDCVLNFGVPEFLGAWRTGDEVAAAVKAAILRFEPRILPTTLVVECPTRGLSGRLQVDLHITGELWSRPANLHVLFRTEVDLDQQTVTVEPVDP